MFPKGVVWFLQKVVGRKLEEVLEELKLLEKQGKVEGFFTNAENADKLAGLVEDIQDAVMDYQVCGQNNPIFPSLRPISDFVAAGHLLQELSAYCEHIFLNADLLW